jgi:PKD repeat protein
MRSSIFFFWSMMILLVLMTVIPASAGSKVITPGSIVYIGDEDLDLRSVVGDSITLGWWIPEAQLGSTLPTKTISIEGRQADFAITSSEFGGFPGPWYALDPDTGAVRTPPVFIVISTTPAPKADFTASTTSGTAPLTVLFTDTSTGSPSRWYWHFGDEAASGGDNVAYVQNPYHIYKKPGTYGVTLTIRNDQASTSIQKKEYINVSYAAPVVTASTEGNHILLTWESLPDPNLEGYRVVISKNNKNPRYPNDGYLLWIINNKTNSAIIDGYTEYTDGDFGGYVLPGIRYYASVTAVYKNSNVPGNAVSVQYPSDGAIVKNQSEMIITGTTTGTRVPLTSGGDQSQYLLQVIDEQNKKIEEQNRQIEELTRQQKSMTPVAPEDTAMPTQKSAPALAIVPLALGLLVVIAGRK